jgi:hypothetical protein
MGGIRTVIRRCHSCGDILTGRSDKRFCSHYCRNDFHNDHQKLSNKGIRKVGHILRRNRWVMKAILSLTQNKKSIKLEKSLLYALGFKPDYHTHTFTTENGKVYFFCYEYAWHEIDDEYHIVREDKIKKPEVLSAKAA